MSSEHHALLDSTEDLAVVPGWFLPVDQHLFRWFLSRQREAGIRGDLVELGAYLGKSAIVIGDYVGDGEVFTVVDLFGAEASDVANASENDSSYSTLTREGFEENYLRFHPVLPAVHTALSSAVTEHVDAGSARFVHIDASHLYEHVVGDTAAARSLLAPDGIVVFDDYRSEHTPGVSAAVWGAVLNDGLNPICVTPSKLYGTWGEPAAVRAELRAHLDGDERLWSEVQSVAGHELIRCSYVATGPTREQQLVAKLDRKEQALAQARRRLRRQRERADALEASRSYRLGAALTAPLRALRRRG